MEISREDRASAWTKRISYHKQLFNDNHIAYQGSITPQVLFIRDSHVLYKDDPAFMFIDEATDALLKSFNALGFPEGSWALVDIHSAEHENSTLDLHDVIEIFDPELMIACDDESHNHLKNIWEELAELSPGDVQRVLGRRYLYLGNFADSLDDEHEKQIMWARLKKVPPLDEPY